MTASATPPETGDVVPRVQRGVTSYVRRTNRMTDSQARAWERYGADYLVDLPDLPPTAIVPEGTAPLDLAALFGRTADLVVEIGPGMGESLVPMAAGRPDLDVLAFEVYPPAAAGIVQKASTAGVTNLRIVMADAASGLAHLVGPAAITELWTFFPDPWHKSRHHKRRLVSTAFADVVAARLRPGGLWRLATDWDDYAGWMREVLDPHPAFENVHAGWAPRWQERPVTRFERRGTTAGRAPRDLTYRRTAVTGGSGAEGAPA